MQIPVGREDKLEGVIDLVSMKEIKNSGANGEFLTVTDLLTETNPLSPSLNNPNSISIKNPHPLFKLALEKRNELVEQLADLDEEICELFLNDEFVSPEILKKAIRKVTVDLKFVPVFIGSAFKNKGVQLLLDGVVDYLVNLKNFRSVFNNISHIQVKNEITP